VPGRPSRPRSASARASGSRKASRRSSAASPSAATARRGERCASFSISGTGVLGKDIKATPLGDGIVAFKVQDSGTFVVRDGDGRVVLRDAGSWWSTIVFDSLGDSAPGGEMTSETLGRVNGPHPGLDMDDEFCAMVEDLIG
jgi:hypothetical protein